MAAVGTLSKDSLSSDLGGRSLARRVGQKDAAPPECVSGGSGSSTNTYSTPKTSRRPPPLNLSNGVRWYDASWRSGTPKTPKGFPVNFSWSMNQGGSNGDNCYSLWPVMYNNHSNGPPVTPIFRSANFNNTFESITTPTNKMITPLQKMGFRKTPGASRPGNSRHLASPVAQVAGGCLRASPQSRMPVNGALFKTSRPAGGEVANVLSDERDISARCSTVDGPDGTAVNKEGAIEVMVTNLDYNISGKEWKKILCSEFQQQVQVLGVQVQTQSDNTNVAYIQLATIEEARYAISQFHRKKIGYKRIHVALMDSSSASTSSNTSLEVVALLQDVSANSLPLFKFIELYEKRYHRTISVSELYRLREVVEIQESERTGRTVSLLHRSGNTSLEQAQDVVESPVCELHCRDSLERAAAMDACGLPNVLMCLKTLAPQVHTLLQGHQGSMPILSFPHCYAAEFTQVPGLQVVRDSGVPLEHLLSCVPGVVVVVTPRSGVKKVQWAENKPTPQIEWGRSCVSSPLLSNQLAQFSREVVDLLRHQKSCRMPFSNFIPAYHHYFGRQCRVADYGYTKLMELFEAIPHVVQILGEGNRRQITLSHKAQVKRFTADLLKVLKHQSSKQIHVLDLPIVYNKIATKMFDVTDYGVCYLEDMLAEVPENNIIVDGTAADMVISLPRKDQTPEEKERTQQFALEVVDLLKNSPQFRMPFNKFIPGYHHHFGKQCRVSDYGFSKLQELFEAIPTIVEMTEEEGEKVLCLTYPELVKVLEEHVVVLLKASTAKSLQAEDFPLTYMQHFGNCICFTDYSVATVSELIALVPSAATVELSETGEERIFLVDNSEMERLARQVLILLMDQENAVNLTLGQLETVYQATYGQNITREQINQLLGAKYIEVRTPGLTPGSDLVLSPQDVIGLTPLQQFARDLRTLLRAHQGHLPLPAVDSAYAQLFGVHLVTHAYGYPSLVAMLQAVSHVVAVKGKGYKRTVVLNTDFQDLSEVHPSDLRTDTPSTDSGISEDDPHKHEATVSSSGHMSYYPAAQFAPTSMGLSQPGYTSYYTTAQPTVSPMLQYAASLLPATTNPHYPPLSHHPPPTVYSTGDMYSRTATLYKPISMYNTPPGFYSTSMVNGAPEMYHDGPYVVPQGSEEMYQIIPTVPGIGACPSDAYQVVSTSKASTPGRVETPKRSRLAARFDGAALSPTCTSQQ